MASGLAGAIFVFLAFTVLQNFFYSKSSEISKIGNGLLVSTCAEEVNVRMKHLDRINLCFWKLKLKSTRKPKGSPPRTVSGGKLYLLLTLLLSGDLELNPGPVKDPCAVCSKCVRKNQRGIACDSCDSWFHTKCIGMDMATYQIYCEDETVPFNCRDCIDTLNVSNQTLPANIDAGPPSSPTIDTSIAEDLWKTVKGLKIGHVNTGLGGGLMYHLEEVHCLLVEKSPDVLAVSETWLHDGYDKGLIETDSYAFYSRQKSSDWPGEQGVGFFIKRTYNFNACQEFEHRNIMNCTVELKRKSCKPIIVSCVYRHYSSRRQWYDDLEELVKTLDATGHKFIMTGDFNIDVNKPDSKTLLDMMNDYGLCQVIESPTRITASSSTCIDLTFTNIDRYTSGVLKIAVADHLLNFIILGEKTQGASHKTITARNLKRVNPDSLLKDLECAPWSILDTFEDANDCYNTWINIYEDVLNQHCPPRKYVSAIKTLISGGTMMRLTQLELSVTRHSKMQ